MGNEDNQVNDAIAGSEEAFHQLVRLHGAHVRQGRGPPRTVKGFS